MTSALSKLQNRGYEVFLLEKEDRLGGNLWNLHYTLDGRSVPALRDSLISKVTNHPLIHVIMNASVVDFTGSKGNFTTGVKVGPDGEYQKIQHGVAILATGAYEWKPTEYSYGEDPRILTQLDSRIG